MTMVRAAMPAWVAWVAPARARDELAFRRLYAQHHRLVMSIALQTHDAVAAEDLVQDVFARAWQRLGELDDDRAFAKWIVQIARNLAVDQLRRARRSPVRAAGTLPMPEREAPASAALDDAVFVVRTIKGLPPAYVEPLLLRLVGGCSAKEIAELTGLTPGSVRVNLHRGMAILRERLGDEGGRA